jgi:hypothetical protein
MFLLSEQPNTMVLDASASTAPAARKSTRKEHVSSEVSQEHLVSTVFKNLDALAAKTAGSIVIFTDGDGKVVKKSTDSYLVKLFVMLKVVELMDKSASTKLISAFSKCIDTFGVNFLKRIESESRYAAMLYQSNDRSEQWGSYIIAVPSIRKTLTAAKLIVSTPAPEDPRDILKRRAAASKEGAKKGKKAVAREMFD